MLCTKCKINRSIDDFAWAVLNVRRRTVCKICHREYARQHYINQKEKYGIRDKKSKFDYLKKIRESLTVYLHRGCVDCRETDMRVLEFDHIDRTTKIDTICNMLRKRRKWELVEAEIRKCVVRCANCHKKRTASQLNYWTVLF